MWPGVVVFFGVVHSRAKWPERPQLKQVWPEAAPTVGGAGRRITCGGGGSLRCCPLVLMLRWAGSPLLLRTLMLMLVLVRLSRWVGGAVVVHHPVLWRSTSGWSSHNLPLIGFLVCVDGVICDHHIDEEL
jgi:hypothetical protein